MDPSAPNNPNNSNPQAPTSPIQPGQFVVAGEEAPPAATAPQPTVETQSPAAPPPAPIPTVNLAQDKEGQQPQVFPNAPVGPAASQPDPTPFSPTGQILPDTQNLGTPAAPSGGSKKLLLVIPIVLILVGIIGAVVYFFVLPKNKTGAKTTGADVQVEEPSPTPARTGAGFGDLQSTGSATPGSTSSGLPDTSTTNPSP